VRLRVLIVALIAIGVLIPTALVLMQQRAAVHATVGNAPRRLPVQRKRWIAARGAAVVHAAMTAL
jgi:hypothetical protein